MRLPRFHTSNALRTNPLPLAPLPARYGDAVKELSESKGSALRTGDAERLDKYLRAWADTLEAMVEEKLTEARRKIRWAACRGKQASLEREADRMWGITSTRPSKLRRLVRGGAAPRGLDRGNQEEVSKFIEEEKKEAERLRPKDGRARLLGFGDGSFPAGYRGHRSMPRKALLAKLMHRGPVVLIDERNSSMLCPCCGKKLRLCSWISTSTPPCPHRQQQRLLPRPLHS